MKKKIILSCMFASLCVFPTFAMSSDELLASNLTDESRVMEAHVVPIMSRETREAVDEFAIAWIEARMQQGLSDTMEVKITTKPMDRYVDTFLHHAQERVVFFVRAHNWNAHNHFERVYSYMTLPGKNTHGSYVNSYGFDVLHSLVLDLKQSLKDIEQLPTTSVEDVEMVFFNSLDRIQREVSNDELRHYLQEVVTFAAKQTTKELSMMNIKEKPVRKIDLWQAIQSK